MKRKILFLDDIFSNTFRSKLTKEELLWDDHWVESVTKALAAGKRSVGIDFEVVKSGDVEGCLAVVEAERPHILLCDMFWPEHAQEQFGDRKRAAEVGLAAVAGVRKEHSALPIVAYTVNPQVDLMQKAYAAGATFFLEKVPVALPEVQSPLAFILAYLISKS